MSLICELARIESLVRDLPAPSTWLVPAEVKRLSGFSDARRRSSFLAGRWLARIALARWQAANSPLPSVDEQGRSFVVGEPGLFLSISHSADWVACAVAAAPIGLDIEAAGRQRDFTALAELVHGPAQYQAIANAGSEAERARQFYQWWTLKEAWFKRQGQGLDLARMPRLNFESCGREAMTAASFVANDLGLVLALDSPALMGRQTVEFGGVLRQPLWRLKSPTLAASAALD